MHAWTGPSNAPYHTLQAYKKPAEKYIVQDGGTVLLLPAKMPHGLLMQVCVWVGGERTLII